MLLESRFNELGNVPIQEFRISCLDIRIEAKGNAMSIKNNSTINIVNQNPIAIIELKMPKGNLIIVIKKSMFSFFRSYKNLLVAIVVKTMDL